MMLVYICSPYAGDIRENIKFARAACRHAIEKDCAPIAIHLLYPQLIDDTIPAQREQGIRMGLRVLAACNELWVCGERVSQGMNCEITEAKRLGIPIKIISAEQIQGGISMKQLEPYFAKKIQIELEEAPAPSMKLQY